MNRIFLFFLVLMLVGCESDPVLTALKPSETVIEVKETALPEKSSIDMDYLFQHKPSALQIQIRKEQSLNASGSLLEKVWELLKQSNKLAAGVVYNDQQYDLDEADITLSFSSYKPIILNTKYFYFRFAGETTFYALPMGTSYKWGHLTKESTLNGLEYTGFAEKLLNEQEVDLDGDGKAEKMSLVYNGDLELRINGLSEIVYANLADIDSVYRTMNQKPEISIESPSEGTHKKMIVSLVWATNKIGSTVEMWVYEYRNEQIKRIWQLADEQPKTITTYNGNRNITVEIAEYRLK
ncbi:MAG: hypothetical protein JWM44_4036 [Bacilli bacterium]|nr:hypothetical protein [Bacilli bacterium]